MNASRRQVLVQGAVIGAGFLTSSMSGLSAFAASPPVRRSLQGLAWNDPIVQTYRDAVGIMKGLPTNNPLNWVQLSNIHGNYDPDTGNGGYNFCPHGDWYFLPWHRAFTAMYERIVRSLTKNNDFAMPYWDWTTNPNLPDVFLPAQTPDGKTNWLAIQDANAQRTWDTTQPMPPDIVGPDVLATILGETPYETFGTGKNPQQTDLDPSWVPAGGGIQGTLESTPHNNVHNNIGGWMPSPGSPRDPIFFMHHSNIDRIWAVWNANNANSKDPLWTDMTFTNNYINPDGQTMWSPQVKDLFSPEALGYTYDLPAVPVASASATVLALDAKLRTVFHAAKPTSAAGIDIVRVANTGAATASAPLAIPLDLPKGALDAIAARRPLSAGLSTLGFQAAAQARATGTRAIAVIRDIAVTDARTTAFRVFLNDDALTPDTPSTDPHFVGTFAFLDHSFHHGSHKAPPSVAVDLTDTLQRLLGGAAPVTGPVRLQIQPVANRKDAKVGTATPTSVEVLLVAS
jgi:tyrosinase